MKKKFVLNPLTGKFDVIGHIPQLDSDPASPSQEDAWVLRTAGGGAGAGEPYGLLLALTQPGAGGTTYKFKYRTKEGTTKEAALA